MGMDMFLNGALGWEGVGWECGLERRLGLASNMGWVYGLEWDWNEVVGLDGKLDVE